MIMYVSRNGLPPEPEESHCEVTITQDYLKAIGRVVTNWALFEAILNADIFFYDYADKAKLWDLFDKDDSPDPNVTFKDLDLYKLNAFKRRRKAFLGVLDNSHFTKGRKEAYSKVLSKAYNLKLHRDKIVHGEWRATNKNNGEVFNFRFFQKLEQTLDHYTLKELNKIADKIAICTARIQSIKGGERHATSPYRRFSPKLRDRRRQPPMRPKP